MQPMAWRIDEAVIRGEIDNTVEGRTTGKVWLVGREDPLVLDLDGDCLRDLAGTRLMFVNPAPQEQADALTLVPQQTGLIGDMTASRRCRVPDLMSLESEGQEERHEWRNVLSLEWFSNTNGRVVIESDSFQLEISAHEWSMDEDAEAAQQLSNLHAMREFIGQVIQRKENEEGNEAASEMNEYEWEERLKESDRLTDAYQEVLEKYMEDPEGERKEAFVMGWDGLLDAMADQEEEEERGDFDASDFSDMEEEEDEEDDEEGWMDADDFGDEDSHPLQARAQEIALRAMDLMERESKPDSPAHAVVSNLLQVTGKLAGALNGRSSGYEPETGYVLAVLKRCLSWLNEAVGACQELIAVETDLDHRAALVHLRSSIFEVRDGVTELRRELK
jgi:hypothetical protein